MCAGPACPLGKSRIVFIITLLIVLGGLGFCIYWFGVRDKDYSKVKVALSQAELLDGNFCYFWISYYNETYQAAKERCAVTNTTILNLGVNSRSDGTGTVDGNADFLAWIETYREVIFRTENNHTVWASIADENANGYLATFFSDRPMKITPATGDTNHTYICQTKMEADCVIRGGGEPYLEH